MSLHGVCSLVQNLFPPALFGYDNLGRLNSIKEPRHTQPSTANYVTATDQIETVTDPAGHTTNLFSIPTTRPARAN